jgi:MFS family permease
MDVPSPAFRHALPLLTVTLVNRMATIGLSLLPALLVEREAGPLAAAVSMGISRAGITVGTVGGGVAADRYGLKPTLIASMVVTGLGVAGMGLRGPLWVLVLFAVVAQIGTGVFPTVARLILMELVPISEQREALAWQRSTANLGLVVSFGLGAVLGTQVALLLALDALASFSAAALAVRLPAARAPSTTEGRAPTTPSGSSW